MKNSKIGEIRKIEKHFSDLNNSWIHYDNRNISRQKKTFKKEKSKILKNVYRKVGPWKAFCCLGCLKIHK